MGYREGYWREELAEYEQIVIAQAEAEMARQEATGKTKFNGARSAKVAQRVKGVVLDRKLQMEKFNDLMYKEIEQLEKSLSDAAAVTFDNYASVFGFMMEEIVNAKNTTELLTLAKLYNQGNFDQMFADLKNGVGKEPIEPEEKYSQYAGVKEEITNQNIKEEISHENNNQNPDDVRANVDVRAIMPEEINRPGTEQPDEHNPDTYGELLTRHLDDREVRNDLVKHPGRNG
jgi:hypothetical protein